MLFWFIQIDFELFLSNLVKASHYPSESNCSDLGHAWVHALAVPINTDGSKPTEGVGCAAVFPDIDVFISFPQVDSQRNYLLLSSPFLCFLVFVFLCFIVFVFCCSGFLLKFVFAFLSLFRIFWIFLSKCNIPPYNGGTI